MRSYSMTEAGAPADKLEYSTTDPLLCAWTNAMDSDTTSREPARPDRPRVAIVGAGAMGSIFGAALSAAGCDTVFVDVSRPLVERLGEGGLVIVDESEERRIAVQATTDPLSAGARDLVFFWVKCYQTESAARFVSPLVGPNTVVASLQNGWGNGEILGRFFPSEQITVGVTYDSGTVLEPGRVAHTYKAETFVGPYAGDSLDDARWVAEVVSNAGIRVTATPAIRAAIWEKLVMTASVLPVAALTGLTSGALREPGPTLDLVDGLAREAVDTGRAAGYDLDVEEQLEKIRAALFGEGKASMLQDVEAGRRTEIDVVNGAVVREAQAHGIDVPLNRAMIALITGHERAHGIAT